MVWFRINKIELIISANEFGVECGKIRLPQWLLHKEIACSVGAPGDASSILGSGRSLGGGHDNPLQYSCLRNPMHRAAWQATVHRVAKSWTQLKRLSMHACVKFFLKNYDSSIFGMALLFTEKREMKRRFDSDNKEFSLRHIMFEIIQTHPSVILSRELGMWISEFHLFSILQKNYSIFWVSFS